MGERDQYVYWRISDTSRTEFDGDLFQASGDSKSGPLRPASQHSAMVVRADREELDIFSEAGFAPVAVIAIGEKLLAGRFDFDNGPENYHDQTSIALGVGQNALTGTIAARRPDNALVPVETAVRVGGLDGSPGVPYSQLRQQFPAAIWL